MLCENGIRIYSQNLIRIKVPHAQLEEEDLLGKKHRLKFYGFILHYINRWNFLRFNYALSQRLKA